MPQAQTEAQKLARFVDRATEQDLSPEAVDALKLRVLDSLAVAFGALGGEPIRAIRSALEEFAEPAGKTATLIGGGQAALDRAAFYNGALVRYLDFNDGFLAPRETCHPSDNIAAVLAAAESADASGSEFLAALAVAYQVQIRLSEAAPVRDKGFDHTTQGCYAAACGVSKALRLTSEQTAHAIAMAGVSGNALRVTRTGALSHWKGLAYSYAASSALRCALLAAHGITGPLEVFEGNKGFQQTISGPFQIDWEHEGLEGVRRTILKKFNAELHSQSAIEAVLELKDRHAIQASEVDRIEVDTFQVAYDIIGGGEEGDKILVRTKEEADHSLRYILAVALLDGSVLPSQYDPKRIVRPDVQELLRLVHIKPDPALTARFPREMPARVRIRLKDGRSYEAERRDYEGFVTRPMSWSSVETKFHRLAEAHVDEALRQRIIEAVHRLDTVRIRDLVSLLAFKEDTKMEKQERAFSFIPLNSRPPKPRRKGLTEIRGPYYSVMGVRYLSDVLETMGHYVDGLKFAGGSFALMPKVEVKKLIDLAHQHGAYVSTGGWIEHVLTLGPEIVDRYLEEAKALGFDVLELSTGFVTLPEDDLLRLIEKVKRVGMKPKPELGIQFGAGGATQTAELEAEGTRDVGWLTSRAKRCLSAGAEILMIESEGITESVSTWRTDVVARIANELGLDKVMFEAADPAVFEWYVKTYGADVNLFVDHSQIVQLEALRSGIWGTKSTWGRIVSYPGAGTISGKKAA